jgi:hypothetical protein
MIASLTAGGRIPSRILSRYTGGLWLHRKSTRSPLVSPNHACGRISLVYFISGATPSYPSASVTESLLSLSSALQKLGMDRNQERRNGVVGRTLLHLIDQLSGVYKDENGSQAMFDWAFLSMFSDVYKDDGGWKDTRRLILAKVSALEVRQMLFFASIMIEIILHRWPTQYQIFRL